MMVRAQPHLFVCLLAVLYAQPLTAADGVRNISLAAFRYSALKIIQQDGLPVRKPQADWEVARAKVQADPAWQSWVENHRKSLDIWISKPRDRAELEAGWGFDLINPANGALVKWTSEMPEPTEHSAYSVKYKQAWASWNRSYNIGKLLEAARMYRLTGEVRYANWATSQLDFYANNYSAWPLRQWNGKARMMGQSLDEATAVVSLIEAVNLLSGYVGAQKKELWRQKLFNPIVGNLRDFNQGVNNIALWHAVAIALVGFQYHDTALISEALDGPKGVGELMKKGVTNDDLWYEGSFAYNAYVVKIGRAHV